MECEPLGLPIESKSKTKVLHSSLGFRFIMRPIKLAVIGTITKDTITFPNGKVTRSFGGILYNVLPLAQATQQDIIISPVCNLGSDIYKRVIFYLKEFDNIELSGISRVGGKNNHVHLFYDRRWHKKEILKNLVPKIEFHQVKPYLDSDYLLINFISGFDIGLDTLRKIKAKTHSPIFIDVHSLILGITKNGKRFFKAPALWREYLKIADIVQMNFKEMQIISGSHLKPENEMKEFARTILNLGPDILLVTRGRKGALLYYKKSKKIIRYQTSALKVRDFVDPTGCGDVFSSGFLLAYLKTSNTELSCEYANFLAGMKSRFSGIEMFLGKNIGV
ncbi:MAG: carbohydrate kinase family protein [candidate division Zixibacteria bacterium]|nr:carbohydrate kinase family protein [candidate division Zixibacteria bacterium]